jgi:hypothetical protein
MIILVGALVFSVRTPLAVTFLVIAQGLVLYVVVWLFKSHDILYDPTYVLFTLALSTVVLPVAKVSHERGYYKKQFEIAEENAALLEKKMKERTDQNRKLR